jgi:hypothetical protein
MRIVPVIGWLENGFPPVAPELTMLRANNPISTAWRLAHWVIGTPLILIVYFVLNSSRTMYLTMAGTCSFFTIKVTYDEYMRKNLLRNRREETIFY